MQGPLTVNHGLRGTVTKRSGKTPAQSPAESAPPPPHGGIRCSQLHPWVHSKAPAGPALGECMQTCLSPGDREKLGKVREPHSLGGYRSFEMHMVGWMGHGACKAVSASDTPRIVYTCCALKPP